MDFLRPSLFPKNCAVAKHPSHWSRSRMLDRCHDVCGGTKAGLWADLAGFGGGQRRPCPLPSCSAGTLEVGLLSPCTFGSICKRLPCTDSCRITRHGSLGKATRDEAALLHHASVRIAWAPRHRASCVLGNVCSRVYVKGVSLACPALYVACCICVRAATQACYLQERVISVTLAQEPWA